MDCVQFSWNSLKNIWILYMKEWLKISSSDLQVGDYIPLGINSPCDNLCEDGDCCHKDAICSCGTSTGHYSCVCPTGYYGSGLKEEGCSCKKTIQLNNHLNSFPNDFVILVCPIGFYSDGPNLCTPCPDKFHTTTPPAYGRSSCQCKTGFKPSNDTDECEGENFIISP